MTGPKPSGPTHPVPTGPPKDADDAIFTTVGELYADLARPHKPRPPSKPPRKPIQTKPIRGTQTPARQSPSEHAGGPVKPDSEGCHAGGASPAPGVASGFALPPTPGLPRFDTRPSDPPDPQPIPKPHPYPPPFQAGVGRYDALPRWQR